MNEQYLEELDELRKYLEIPKDEFTKLLLIALKYQKISNQHISDEDLLQILYEAMGNFDYQDEQYKNEISMKTTEESFNRAIDNLGYQKVKKY